MISLISPNLRYTGVTLACPQRVDIPDGVVAVIGRNGSGKSTLASIIECGWNFMTNHLESDLPRRPRVRTIAFSNLHSLTGFTAGYYQQRYESMMNDDVPTVAELMSDRLDTALWREMSAKLGLDNCVDKRANFLSSGELRKLLIINMLFESPDILVLDNPYIGLDITARGAVDEAIVEISRRGVTVMLLVCDPADVPDSVSAIVPMSALTVHPVLIPGRDGTVGELRERLGAMFDYALDPAALERVMAEAPAMPDGPAGAAVVEMRDCEVRYGDRVIIDSVDWAIHSGECWALSGPNGSGKSTLLSLINADNPQAYSNDITLFGRRRGTGESIWDIKRRIGFLSAELHLYFSAASQTVGMILDRAMRDTPADFGALTAQRQSMLTAWIEIFGLGDLADRAFRTLSFGEQRLVLLVAAIARMPELLILDEPMHGLDLSVKRAVTQVVEMLASTCRTIIYVTHRTDELPGCVSHHKSLTRQ